MQNTALFLLCLLAIIMWPINRIAMKANAKMENYGIIISFTVFSLGIIAALINKKEIINFPASLFGIGVGIAYSIGFCMIIFYCLKIGPTGPTTAINNLGVIFPTVLSLTFFANTQSIKALTILGVILTLASLMLMVFTNSNRTNKISEKWKMLVFIGWIFSGTSLSMQLLATHFSPKSSYAFVISTFLTSFVILVIISIYHRNLKVSRIELICGTANGIITILINILLFYVSQYIAGYIVFPVILIIPIISMMLIGNFFYKEKINILGGLATLFGALGILLMYL